jgi:hypothetical protein
MVGVTVGYQNDIGLDFRDIHSRCQRVGSDEWIKQQAGAAGLDEKAGMAEMSEFHSTQKKPQPLARCTV